MPKSKYTDVPSIMQVLGGIYLDPMRLSDEKYHFNAEDFTEDIHKVLFGAMYDLFNQSNVTSLSPVVIEDYLGNYPKQLAIYKQCKGKEYLEKIKNTAQVAAFDYYYHRMKKFTLMRMYQERAGMDLSDIYDVNNILDIKKKERQEKWLDQASLNDISQEIENRIEKVKSKYVDNCDDKFSQAGKGASTLIDNLIQHPEAGFPLYGDINNAITRGARLGKFYLRSAATGVGKAIPNSTYIPTPDGWKLVGDIKVGDFLFGQDGKPTKVLATYPQPEKKDVWEVRLWDGRIARCCGEHLWEYSCSTSIKDQVWEVKSTAELAAEMAAHPETYYYIKVTHPVEYKEQQYSVDPYEYGKHLAANGNEIPLVYLTGSVEQRQQLFQGIMDAGKMRIGGARGFVKNSVTHWEYLCTMQQRASFLSLCRSLGIPAGVNDKRRYPGSVAVYKFPWEVNSTMFKKDDDDLFLIIREVVKTNDEPEEMTCFTVDNDSHLFLMNDYIVTHNTRAMIADACTIGCSEVWKNGKWERGCNKPAVYISTEQELDEVQTMMLAFVSNVNEDHILYNHYEPGELDRVKYAATVLENSPIHIKLLPDFNLQDIEDTIKTGLREYKAQYCFMDYIHTSIKILSEVSTKSKVEGLKEYNVLFMIAVKLKDLAVSNNIFIESATQLNSAYQEAAVYDQNLLRGAKSIADKIDLGQIMLNVEEADAEKIQPILTRYGFPEPDTKISVYKNRRGRYNNLLIWCKSNKGVCKIDPLFVTDYSFKYVDITPLEIKFKQEERVF